MRKSRGDHHGSCKFDTATVPAVLRQDLGIGSKDGDLANSQQEQIRLAEAVIQQLRANPTNPRPPLRAAFQKPVTEGGAFKALTKYTGKHSEYHDWSCSATRVLTRADERFVGLQWISGEIDEVNEKYRRTTDLSSTDMDWFNSEDKAMASIKSLEEVEVKGIIGWQRLEREARGYRAHRVALLTEISDSSAKSVESH